LLRTNPVVLLERGLAAIIGRERFLDQIVNDAFRKLRGFLGGNADVLSGIIDLSMKIQRDVKAFLAKLVFEVGESNLTFSDVVHDICVLLMYYCHETLVAQIPKLILRMV